MFSFRYPAVVILICVAAGTLVGRQYGPGMPVAVIIAGGALAALIAVYLWAPARYFIVPLALLSLCGAWMSAAARYQTLPADDISRFLSDRSRLGVFGRIAAWPEIKREKTYITCRVDSLVRNDSVFSVSGRVLLVVGRATTRFALGDNIHVTERVVVPRRGNFPGSFDYRQYLMDKGIRGLAYISDAAQVEISVAAENSFGRLVSRLRQSILDVFRNHLSEIPAAMASGFLIGETRDIPEELYQAFRRTGTIHLLAVSGSNVALVLVVVLALFRFIPCHRVLRLALLLAVIVLFSHLSYNQPSVIRASIVAALVLAARVLYRRVDLNNILASAAAVLIVYDPGNLFDVGFQLSFAVAWGLVVFLPPLHHLSEQYRWPASVRYGALLLSSSLIATLISAPITLAYFGQASLMAVFSNMLVVPLVSIGVVGILILLLVHPILPALAIVPAMAVDRLLNLTASTVAWFGGWETAVITWPSFSGLHAVFGLALVCCLFAAIQHKIVRRVTVFVILGSAAVWLAGAALYAKDMPDVEVYNEGASQTVIINRFGGLVIYREAKAGRYDSFGSSLIPYLAGRKGIQPRHFLFFEPRYRTALRLEKRYDHQDMPELWPVVTSRVPEVPSLWSTGPSPDSISNTADSIVLGPGMAVIAPEGGPRIIIAEAADVVSMLAPEPNQRDYYFFFIDNQKELNEIAGRIGDAEVIIVLTRPQQYYNFLSDSLLSGQGDIRLKGVIENGTNADFDLGGWN